MGTEETQSMSKIAFVPKPARKPYRAPLVTEPQEKHPVFPTEQMAPPTIPPPIITVAEVSITPQQPTQKASPLEYEDFPSFTNMDQLTALFSTGNRQKDLEPLNVSQEIITLAQSILQQAQNSTELDKAIIICRYLIPKDRSFKVEEGSFLKNIFGKKFHGENGLAISPGTYDGFMEKLRKGSPLLGLPDDYISGGQKDRVALCLQYSLLLTVLLRASNIDAYVSIPERSTNLHAYVLAKLDGKTYAIDLLNLTFKETSEPYDTSEGRDNAATAKYISSLGATYQAIQDYNMAIPYFNLLVILYPKIGEAWARLGYIFFIQGKLDNAKICFEQALKIDKNNAFAQSKLGDVLQKKGELGNAKTAYIKAIAENKARLEKLEGLRSWHMSFLEFKEAKQCKDEIAFIDTQIAEDLRDLGDIAIKEKNYKQALAYYKESLAFDKDSFETYLGIGIALYYLGHNIKAIRFYKKALALKFNELKQSSLPKELKLAIKTYLESSPEETATLENIFDEPPSFSDELNGCLRVSKQDISSILFNIGLAYENLGRHKKAFAFYSKAFEINPLNYSALANKQLIEASIPSAQP